ncbi:unnamed protein product [Penicillium nalgiovense]|nr:unnamed protein product [Penicillium nalgiovense]CAG8888936.1 unnamed protein product [Penicillium nalgiovense]
MVTVLMKTIRTFCELYEQEVSSCSRHSSRMRSEHVCCLLVLPDTDGISCSLSLPHDHWWHRY